MSEEKTTVRLCGQRTVTIPGDIVRLCESIFKATVPVAVNVPDVDMGTVAVLAVLTDGISNKIHKAKMGPDECCDLCRTMVSAALTVTNRNRRARDERIVQEAMQRGLDIGISLSQVAERQ